MTMYVFRYKFADSAPIEDVEASLVLAILATESLHGETQVRLSCSHHFDAELRLCAISASDEVGADLNRLFAGFLRREFGPESFQVERVAEAELSAA